MILFFNLSKGNLPRRPDTPIWKLEAALKCRSCRTPRYSPPVGWWRWRNRGSCRLTFGCIRARSGEGAGPRRRVFLWSKNPLQRSQRLTARAGLSWFGFWAVAAPARFGVALPNAFLSVENHLGSSTGSSAACSRSDGTSSRFRLKTRPIKPLPTKRPPATISQKPGSASITSPLCQKGAPVRRRVGYTLGRFPKQWNCLMPAIHTSSQ